MTAVNSRLFPHPLKVGKDVDHQSPGDGITAQLTEAVAVLVDKS
jgi:hypothetical protein